MSSPSFTEFAAAAQMFREEAGRVIVGALESYDLHWGGSWSDYEIQQTVVELAALGDGADCTYDRPSVGVLYASWYHPKRVDDMIRMLFNRFVSSRTLIEIVDIGCGTGATAWAAVWINQTRTKLGLPPIPVTITASDSSPFMVGVAEYLWSALGTSESFAAGFASVDLTITTSHRPKNVRMEDPILTAGYLIDSSDRTQPGEVANALAALGEAFGCRELYMTTSVRKSTSVVSEALAGFRELGWSDEISNEVASILGHDEIVYLANFRKLFFDGRDVRPGLATGVPTWSDGWTAFSFLKRTDDGGIASTLALDLNFRTFDAVQQKAVEGYDSGPECIIGAAGSGKSLVLMHRVARTIQESFGGQIDLNPRVLVTCFNREMVAVLADMLSEAFEDISGRISVRVDGDDPSDQTIHLRDGDRRATVRLLNHDKIPTRIMGKRYSPNPGKGGQVPGGFRTLRLLPEGEQSSFGKYLEEDFLLDEINCVVAGQGADTWEAYALVQRRGRPYPTLSRGGRERELIWAAIEDYPTAAFAYRWRDLIADWKEDIDEGESIIEAPYSHVFVDEAQDFTEYQLRFLAALGESLDDFVIAVDQAQSIRLGPAFYRPTFRGNRWADLHRLEGSFRLPVRVAEAVRPLAQGIAAMHRRSGSRSETSVPYGRKAAVLGFRPVVLAPDDSLEDVLETYLPRIELNGRGVTVAQENGNGLGARLRESDLVDERVETAWVESIKGQERPVMVWRTGALRSDDVGMAETVYTVATRTTSLLVILLDRDADPAVKSLVGRLDPDRLLFWSSEAKAEWMRCRELVGSEYDPLESVEFEELAPAAEEIEEVPVLLSDDQMRSLLLSTDLPKSWDDGVRAGRERVRRAGDMVRIGREVGSSQFTVSVFDEALEDWLLEGRPSEMVRLGRIQHEHRIQQLLRVFLALEHGPS